MNVSIRLIVAAILAAVAAASAQAQRVEFPTPTDPYAATVSPYPGTPYPGPAPAPVGPPPTFDPYASTPLAPPPVSLPYNYTPPGTPAPVGPVNPWQTSPPGGSPQSPGVLLPQGFPYEWQPGSYGYQSPDGTMVKVQRLLQEISLEATYLYGESGDPSDMSILRSELSSTFAVPMFYNTDTPLLVTPGFAVNYLQGPVGLRIPAPPGPGPEMPPRVYDAYLDFGWYPKVNEIFGGELGFRTGVWSDFDHVTSDSVRFLGRGLASVALTPQLDVLFGAVYLDRLDIKLLPAGGVYWRPTPEWDLYLVFPNPKARKRLMNIGNSQWFWYVAGEYGMGSWTVERSGLGDQADINDIRVSGGLEWETQTQIRGHIEAGYVFDRELIFRSNEPSFYDLDDTFMIRGGIDF